MRKQDLDYHVMFDIYRRRDPAEQWRIMEYCWYDSAVCIWVGTARGYWTTVLQEARVTQTRIDDIFNGGQQIKVYSALAHICSGGDVLKSMRAQPKNAEPLPDCGFAINDWARTGVARLQKPVAEDEEDDPVRAPPTTRAQSYCRRGPHSTRTPSSRWTLPPCTRPSSAPTTSASRPSSSTLTGSPSWQSGGTSSSAWRRRPQRRTCSNFCGIPSRHLEVHDRAHRRRQGV